MAMRMGDVIKAGLAELRTYHVGAHVRARLGDEYVVSSDRALLVWEPGRVIPTYAVPTADVYGDLVPWKGTGDAASAEGTPDGAGIQVLSPLSPFSVHTCAGRPLSIRTGGQGELDGAAFAFDDPDLSSYVALDFGAFDAWTEEDDEVVGSPQDPFHRVACRRTSQHVVVSREGVVLADSRGAILLLETNLPGRFYLPRSDVRQELLTPTATRTKCPYKGVATYWSARVGDRIVADVAWSYEEPLTEAAPVAGRLCFWNERTDLTVDGEPVPRPQSPWS